MTLRDFLKDNGSLTSFKKAYHERNKTKITYRQIEANLLTAGEDFIKRALNLKGSDFPYWIDLNIKWNALLNSKTFGDWLRANNLEEKFKNAYLKQHSKHKHELNQILMCTDSNAICCAFIWKYTEEGTEFWHRQHFTWEKFCKNK